MAMIIAKNTTITHGITILSVCVRFDFFIAIVNNLVGALDSTQ
jgi:hypothetical protein